MKKVGCLLPCNWTEAQFEQIAPLLPRQRGNMRLNNLQAFNAIRYVAANGCIPIVPPNPQRRRLSWEYDKQRYTPPA